MRKAGIALSLLACLPVLARAGPPMITSDPGTPGDGRWENNFAVTLERRPSGRTWAAPDIDLNYGLGNSIVGVKWRFSDEEKHGISMSAKGEFEFNPPTSSADRGVVEEGTVFRLPVRMEKKLGRSAELPEARDRVQRGHHMGLEQAILLAALRRQEFPGICQRRSEPASLRRYANAVVGGRSMA